MRRLITFTALQFEHINGEDYRLIKPLLVTVEKETFEIPEGFVTDCASVPRGMWNLFPPTGSYAKAAVFHDWLYRGGKVSRKQADELFLDAMECLGEPWLTRYCLYWGVRLGGWMAWDSYADKRIFGEILDE